MKSRWLFLFRLVLCLFLCDSFCVATLVNRLNGHKQAKRQCWCLWKWRRLQRWRLVNIIWNTKYQRYHNKIHDETHKNKHTKKHTEIQALDLVWWPTVIALLLTWWWYTSCYPPAAPVLNAFGSPKLIYHKKSVSVLLFFPYFFCIWFLSMCLGHSLAIYIHEWNMGCATTLNRIKTT